MSKEASSTIVLDSSVLINFLAVGRLDLIEKCEHRFLVTHHVKEEITAHYADRFARFQSALVDGIIDPIRVDDPQEITIFAQLSSGGRLGLGECSAIAVAIHRHYILAIDDKQAAKQALALCHDLRIVTTKDLMLSMIQAGLLDTVGADDIKDEWATHHCFRLKIGSFSDLL